jgi:hypothetical protein
MSTLANITSLNLSLQTGGAALAVKAVKSVAKPARTVYVFGTADDVAPNFTTVAGAITYANSLTPIVTEPVVVRLFTKADGTPYDLTNLSSWTTYAIDYIYFVSDFVRLNVTDTLPTTLPAGLQVWYIDPNGVETLWVGREDGSAWPAVGYKEYRALISQSFTNAPVATVRIDTIGGSPVWSRSGVGVYVLTNAGKFTTGKKSLSATQRTSFLGDPMAEGIQLTVSETSPNQDICQLNLYEDGVANDGLLAYFFTIRVYP